RGVALIPALGFDYAPGDCLARLAARGLEPLDEVEMAYAIQGFGATRGTMRSALEMMKGGDVVYAEGSWRAPSRMPRRTVELPDPIGARPMAKYPAGEIVTVPRHTEVKNVTAWVAADAFAPHQRLAPAVPFVMPALSALMRRPVRRLLSRAIDRLPEGPGEEDRRAARFTVMATARGSDGSVGRAVARGHDVYGLTAVILSRCAQVLAGAGKGRVGALAPSVAFDAEELLRQLEPHGLTYEVESPSA
ncbi:MAG TPA: hypothetical protein VGR10_06005, partial [Thermoleophilaceae bacterium]|nr:hypothetical protein [Thermoleophilaceae bacterium]